MWKKTYWAIVIISILLTTGIIVILSKYTLDVNNAIALLGVVIAYLAIVWGVYSLRVQLLENNTNVERQLLANSDSLQQELIANNEWNKRHTALMQVYNRVEFIAALKILNKSKVKDKGKVISYQERTVPIPETEIHEIICGNKNCHGTLLALTPEGETIRESIINFLNYYEFLAAGIRSDILDEETVKMIVKSQLIQAHKIFSEYIKHRRERHGYKKSYFELEELVKKWEKEDAPEYSKRESVLTKKHKV